MKIHEFSFCPECGQKLDGDEFLCSTCGTKLVDNAVPPQQPMPVVPISDDNTCSASSMSETKVETSKMQTQTVEKPFSETSKLEDGREQSAQPQNDVSESHSMPESRSIYVEKSAKKKSKLWLAILLIVVGLIAVGSGVGVLLISNGTISRSQVEFLPSEILDKFAPVPVEVLPVSKQKFYFAYSYCLIDGKKECIMTDGILDPVDPAKATADGVRTRFREMARIKYSEDYFKFKDIKVREFNDRGKAVDERAATKKDLENKGYKLRLMEVVYSIK